MSGIFVNIVGVEDGLNMNVGVEDGLNMMQIVQVELTRAGLRQCTVAQDPLGVVENLKMQVNDPASRLKHGKYTRRVLRKTQMFPKSAPETPKGPIVYAIKLLLKEIPCNKQDIPGSCMKSRRIDLTQLIHY